MKPRPTLRTRLAALAAWALFAVVAVAPRVFAAPPRYTIDNDPIRLGGKAFEDGRLEDAEADYREAVTAGYQLARAYFGLGEIAARRTRLDEAKQWFTMAIEARTAEGKPEWPEARAALGLVLLRLDRPAEAEAEFNRAAAEKPGLWEAAYGLALLRLAAGAWDEAEALLAGGAKRRGLAEREDGYHYGMALLHLGRGDLADAETEALTAFHMNPAEPEYGLLVARIYRERDLPGMAITAYEQAIATPGAHLGAAVLHDLGTLLSEAGRYTEARDRYLEAVAADSSYAPALRDLADLYRRARQPDLAAKVYLRYVDLVPDDADALTALAETCLEAGRNAEALAAARSAAAADPARTDARAALARAGIAAVSDGDRAAAVEVYLGMADEALWTPRDHLAFGSALRDAGRDEEAAAAFRRAAALDPGLADAPYQLGMLELAASRPDSAIPFLQRAGGLDSTSALYALNLGIAFFQANRVREAVAPFRRAVTLNERLPVGYVLLGQALALVDSLPAATAAYERALELEPGNARALRGLGYCAIRRADYATAERRYRAAAEAEPGNADAWAGLGNARLGLQDWDGAEAAFAKARAIDPRNSTMLKGVELLRQARGGGG